MEQFQQNYPVAFDQIAAILQREIENDAVITIQRFYRMYRTPMLMPQERARAVVSPPPNQLDIVDNFANLAIH